MPPSLILTVTRACNLRCAYCPTAKDGWPALSEEDARRAVNLFATRYVPVGQAGDVKLFGGEPLLVPQVVRAAIDAACARPEIRRVYLSTNGLGLDAEWLGFLAGRPQCILTLSMDGRPEDHRGLRRALPGVADSYQHVLDLLPALRRAPRLVVTQTIAPSTAARASQNFAHLLDLGFRRFNLLPGYYLPWRPAQLQALEAGFSAIGERIQAEWAAGRPLYLRNLFTWAPTPFFNTGLVVDADGSVHPSNVGLSGQLDGLRGQTRLGSLDDPPTPQALAAGAVRVEGLLREALPEGVWAATQAVDAALTRLVRSLYPAWLASKRPGARAVAPG